MMIQSRPYLDSLSSADEIEVWRPHANGEKHEYKCTLADFIAFFPPAPSFDDAFPLGAAVGFFADDGGANVWPVRDRLFVGAAAGHTGNRFGANGYGSDWISQHAASWIIKNATFAAAAPDSGAPRIGILGASRTAPGAPAGVNCGVAALTLNEGGFGRALYAEAMHKSAGGTSVGAEIQVGNYTNDAPSVSAYDMSEGRVNGLYIGAESGTGYTTGDADTPILTPTQPCGAAIDIAGGSLNAAHQKWQSAMVVRDGALTRDASGNADAVLMAQKHRIVWEAAAGVIGAVISSQVTDAPHSDQRLIFANGNVTHFIAGVPVHSLVAQTGNVNGLRMDGSSAGAPVALRTHGADADIDLLIAPKGGGMVRFGQYEAATNSIIVKDSSGTVRRLQCV